METNNYTLKIRNSLDSNFDGQYVTFKPLPGKKNYFFEFIGTSKSHTFIQDVLYNVNKKTGGRRIPVFLANKGGLKRTAGKHRRRCKNI